MESDHEDVQEHDCYVEMNVVQSWTAPDREPDAIRGLLNDNDIATGRSRALESMIATARREINQLQQSIVVC